MPIRIRPPYPTKKLIPATPPPVYETRCETPRLKTPKKFCTVPQTKGKTMAIHIEPEMGVPMGAPPDMKDLTTKTAAAAKTVEHLHANGLEVKVTSDDKDTAAALAVSYAGNPIKSSKIATSKRVAQLTPATLLLTDRILKDFGHSVVKSATQVRHLVTNKLIEETENPDPRIRIRALELLGKINAPDVR